MKKTFIKSIIFAAIGLFSFFSLTSALTTSSFAVSDVCSSKASAEVKKAAGCSGNTDALPNIITGILNAVIAVSGLVAVIFVIIGGVNYMTSSGDAGKLEKAKKTILYALIGLVVCVLSFAIVNWTIGAINRASTDPSQYTTKKSCTDAGFDWNATDKTCS